MYEFIFEVFPKPSNQDYQEYGTMDGAVAHAFVHGASEQGDAEAIARSLIEERGWDIERDTAPVARFLVSPPASALAARYYDRAFVDGSAVCFSIYPSGTFDHDGWREHLDALPWDLA
jgi:hypothetical protein